VSPSNFWEEESPKAISGRWESNRSWDVVFTKEEETPGRDKVVVLSYGLWQRRFGGDKEILGKPVTFDGNLFTVIGVMPRGIYPTWVNSAGQIQFRPDHHQYWVPMALSNGFRTTRRSHVFGVLARLKSGVTFREAQVEMETIGRRLEQAYPENAKEAVALTRLGDEVVGDVRSSKRRSMPLDEGPRRTAGPTHRSQRTPASPSREGNETRPSDLVSTCPLQSTSRP